MEMKRVTYAEGGPASDSDNGDKMSMGSTTKAEEEDSSSDGEGSGASRVAKACYARVFKSATGLVTILSWAAVLQVYRSSL